MFLFVICKCCLAGRADRGPRVPLKKYPLLPAKAALPRPLAPFCTEPKDWKICAAMSDGSEYNEMSTAFHVDGLATTDEMLAAADIATVACRTALARCKDAPRR